MTNDEIIVRKDGEKWGAFYGDRRIAASGCKACVVHSVRLVTKNSERYKVLVVMNEDGTIKETIPIGSNANRSTTQNL
jgi:hypothetical protein